MPPTAAGGGVRRPVYRTGWSPSTTVLGHSDAQEGQRQHTSDDANSPPVDFYRFTLACKSAAELKKVKGCLPHKFAGDNTLRNATNVAFEILGENTGGILILDLKTFEISFQGLT